MTRYFLGVSLVTVALTVAAMAQSASQKVAGYLVDAVCAGNHATEPGYKENHDKACNLMAACIKSGYARLHQGHRQGQGAESGGHRHG